MQTSIDVDAHVCNFRDKIFYMLLIYPKFPLTEAGVLFCDCVFFTIVAISKTIYTNIITQCYKHSDSVVNIVLVVIIFFKG
jgi:hypothetical protein